MRTHYILCAWTEHAGLEPHTEQKANSQIRSASCVVKLLVRLNLSWTAEVQRCPASSEALEARLKPGAPMISNAVVPLVAGPNELRTAPYIVSDGLDRAARAQSISAVLEDPHAGL